MKIEVDLDEQELSQALQEKLDLYHEKQALIEERDYWEKEYHKARMVICKILSNIPDDYE